MAETEQLPVPWELERDLKNVSNPADRIKKTFDVIKIFLKATDHQQNIRKISRIIENPFDGELVYRSLLELYGSIYSLYKKIKEKAGIKVQFNDAKIGDRMAKNVLDEAIDRIVFFYERDVLLAPIRTDLSDKKGESGPAMYSEQVKRSARNLLTSIENQTRELLPTVYHICQHFTGITPSIIGKEERKRGERDRYEEVWLIYQSEQIVIDRIKQIGTFKAEKQSALAKLIDDFIGLRIACQEKIESLGFVKTKSQKQLEKITGEEKTTQHLELADQIKSAAERISKITSGITKLKDTEKMLITLHNLITKFPGIADNIEFYMESGYQAKSVQHFLDEIAEEMKAVFGQRNIEAFEIIATLEYKLRANSLMYDGAEYYQAASYMEKDMTDQLIRWFQEKQEKDIGAKVSEALDKYGMTAMIQQLHACLNRIKKKNNRMHKAMQRFGKKLGEYNEKTSPHVREQSKNELIKNLQYLLQRIDSEISQSVVPNYQHCQEIYQAFSEENIEDKHIGEQVIRCFFELARLGKPIGMKKEELQNFQKFKLYQKMKPNPGMQAYFVKALKKFVKGEDCIEIFPDQIAENFDYEVENITRKLATKHKENLSIPKAELAIKLLSESITPREVESFARVVPSIPRNELRLAYAPGRGFVEIAQKYQEFLRTQSQRQFVLLNPGEEPQSENEIMFKELSAMELVKKAYGILYNYMEPLFKTIHEENQKELDFVSRERSKWQKELDQIIVELQEQVNFAKEKSEPEESNFRILSEDEIDLMKKYIHSDQMDKLEDIFGRTYDVDTDSQLFELEDLVVEIIQGFFKQLEADDLLRSEFEEIQEEKRKLHLGGKTENVEKKIKQIISLRWQKRIEDILKYWEFGIKKVMPKSDVKPQREIKLRNHSNEDLQSMVASINPEQLLRIRQNIAAVRKFAEGRQQQILFNRGVASLTLAQSCFDLLAKDEALMVAAEKESREKLKEFERDDTFRSDVDDILSKSDKGAGHGAFGMSGGDQTKSKKTKTSPSDQLNNLITAFRSRLSGKDYSGGLPKITVKNLKTYALAMTAGQFQNVAWLVKDRIHATKILSEERVLVIVARNCLKLAKGDKIPHADDILEMLPELRLIQKRHQAISTMQKQ